MCDEMSVCRTFAHVVITVTPSWGGALIDQGVTGGANYRFTDTGIISGSQIRSEGHFVSGICTGSDYSNCTDLGPSMMYNWGLETIFDAKDMSKLPDKICVQVWVGYFTSSSHEKTYLEWTCIPMKTITISRTKEQSKQLSKVSAIIINDFSTAGTMFCFGDGARMCKYLLHVCSLYEEILW